MLSITPTPRVNAGTVVPATRTRSTSPVVPASFKSPAFIEKRRDDLCRVATHQVITSCRPEQQRVDRNPEVHAFPAPPCRRRFRIDRDATLGMRGRQRAPMCERLRVPGRRAEQRCPSAIGEAPGAIVAAIDFQAALVHRAVMKPAEQHEIRQLCRAALRPMLDVVPVDVPLVAATGENAAFVARCERTTQRGRDAARLATDIQRLTALVLGDRDDARIAGKAARGFDGSAGPSSSSQRPALALAQRAFVDVHDDLLAIAAAQRLGAVLQEALGQHDERIGAPRRPLGASSLTMNRAQHENSATGAFHLKRAATLDNHRRGWEAAHRATRPRCAFRNSAPLSAGSCSFTTSEPSSIVEIGESSLRVLARLARKLLDFLHATELPHQRLDVMRGAVQCDVEQHVLVGRRRHARERAHLRIAQLAAAHGRGNLRQRLRAHGRPAPSRALPRGRDRTSS